tara:strand:- start:2078 stop:2959 length:882 start_codon:yes stop_codon:yes gene_type:complete
MAFPKYQTKELLNKVLNTGEDALKVDIDNVTLDGSQLSVDIDKENDSIVIYSNTAKDGSGTNYVPLVDSDGHLQVDSVSTALPSGAATAANQSTIIGHVDGIEGLLTTIDTDTGSIDGKMTRGESDVAGGGSGLFQVLAYGKDQSGNLDPLNVDNNGHLKITINDIESGISTALPVSDNGGSLTVDGTVTANLSATDNAVLDNIDTSTSSSNTHLGNMFYDTALAVTPSDGSDLSGEPYFAVWVGTGGDLKVDMADGGAAVTLSNCASGQLIPIMVERIYATGTTASNIIVFK